MSETRTQRLRRLFMEDFGAGLRQGAIFGAVILAGWVAADLLVNGVPASWLRWITWVLDAAIIVLALRITSKRQATRGDRR